MYFKTKQYKLLLVELFKELKTQTYLKKSKLKKKLSQISFDLHFSYLSSHH